MNPWTRWLAAALLMLSSSAWALGPNGADLDPQRDPFGPPPPGSPVPPADVGEPPPQPPPGVGGTGLEGIPPEDVDIFPPPVPEEGIDGTETEELPPPPEEPGVGGAGDSGISPQDVDAFAPPFPDDAEPVEPGVGGAGEQGAPPENGEAIRAIPGAEGASEPRGMRGLMSKPDDLKGVTLMAGGGVETYSGELARSLDAGVAWSVVADARPWSVLGFELGYSGSGSELDANVAAFDDDLMDGADLVRHGGHAAVIVGTPTALQPYVLAGVGVDRYVYTGGDGAFGFRDDVAGSVPLAAGLRAHAGDVTADFRLGYDALFDDEFGPAQDTGALDGRVKGLVQIGGTF